MKLSTTTDVMAKTYGEKEALIRLSEIGYDCVDFTLFNYPTRGELFSGDGTAFRAYFEDLQKTASLHKIGIGQAHSPMPSYTANAEEDEFIFGIQVKSIQAAAYLGSPYIIIHPAIPQEYRYDYYRTETKVLNMAFYRRLLPYLQEYNVKLAIENMFNWDPVKSCICPTVCSHAEEIADYIDTLDSDRFVACLDVGHANLTGNTPDAMVRILGNRLKTVHVHDNYGKSDDHTAPYIGNIHWENFCKSLKEVNYTGSFSFEADNFLLRFGTDMAQDSATMLYKIGKNLLKKYDL